MTSLEYWRAMWAIGIGVAVFNLAMAALNVMISRMLLRRLRKVAALRLALDRLAIDSFLLGHVPYWMAWSKATGGRFHVRVGNAPSEDDEP